eukprot:Partr_v1_DN27520_c0_g1_i1_m30696 putative mitogen-activated protein kinase kinase kinase
MLILSLLVALFFSCVLGESYLNPVAEFPLLLSPTISFEHFKYHPTTRKFSAQGYLPEPSFSHVGILTTILGDNSTIYARNISISLANVYSTSFTMDSIGNVYSGYQAYGNYIADQNWMFSMSFNGTSRYNILLSYSPRIAYFLYLTVSRDESELIACLDLDYSVAIARLNINTGAIKVLYPLGFWGRMHHLVETADAFYVGGRTTGDSSSITGFSFQGGSDGFIGKYALSGALIWAHSFGNPSLNELDKIAVDEKEGLIFGFGFTHGVLFGTGTNSPSKLDIILVCYTTDGEMVWQKQIYTPGYHEFSTDMILNRGTKEIIFLATTESATFSNNGGSGDIIGRYSYAGNRIAVETIARGQWNGRLGEIQCHMYQGVPTLFALFSYSLKLFQPYSSLDASPCYIPSLGSSSSVNTLATATSSLPVSSRIFTTNEAEYVDPTASSMQLAETSLESVSSAFVPRRENDLRSTIMTNEGTDLIQHQNLIVSLWHSLLSNRTILSLIAVCITFALFIGLFVLYCIKTRKLEKLPSSSQEHSTTFSVYSASTGESTTNSVSSMERTLSVGANIFSIPGYLIMTDFVDYRIERAIGRGGGGTVYRGFAFNSSLRTYGDVIVVKRIGTQSSIVTERERVSFEQELAITNYLQTCPNIVRLLGFSSSPPTLLLKFYKFGSLQSFVKNSPKIPRRTVISFLHGISSAVLAMHSGGFIHADLKPNNVLVDFDDRSRRYFCQLTDFGVTQIIDASSIEVKGFQVANMRGLTMLYAAPEVMITHRLGNIVQSQKSDVYALGVMHAFLLNKERIAF